MASTTSPRQITPKQPAEVADYNFDWTKLLDESADTIVASNSAGATHVEVDVNTLVLGDTIVGDKIVKQWVSGGVNGVTYKLTCFVATNQGRYLEAEMFIKVKEI